MNGTELECNGSELRSDGTCAKCARTNARIQAYAAQFAVDQITDILERETNEDRRGALIDAVRTFQSVGKSNHAFDDYSRTLQSQLEQLRAGHQESEKQLREWQDKVVLLMDRLAQVEQEREALQGEVTFLNDKYLEREAAVIESVRSRAIQLCKDKAAKYKALADDSLPNDQTAARTAAMTAALNAIAAEIEKL